MKRVFYLLCTVLALDSCTDYLNVKPRGYDIPNTLEQYEGMIYGHEHFWMSEVFEYMAFEFMTDEDGYGNAYANLGAATCNAFRWQKDIYLPDQECGEWNNPTSILYALNVVIAEVMDASTGTDDQKKAILAEARMLRAWNLFMMAQFFGKPYNEATAGSDRCIPIITEAKTVDAQFPLHTVEEVYTFVLEEMKASVTDLSDAAEHHLRVFKATGFTMLGKVLWMMGRYEEAEPYLETAFKAAAEQGLSLLDFNDMLLEDGTLDYISDFQLNPEYMLMYYSMNRIWPAMYADYYNTLMFGIADKVLFHYYKEKDLRLSTLVGIKSRKSAYEQFKRGNVYAPNTSKLITNLGLELPDLYLMYAECLARNGKQDQARELLYELRCKRMDPAIAGVPEGDLVVVAVEERIREYMGYGNTWFDTRRLWHDPKFQYMKDFYTRTDGSNTYTLTEDRLTLEIPPIVLSWHPEYSINQ